MGTERESPMEIEKQSNASRDRENFFANQALELDYNGDVYLQQVSLNKPGKMETRPLYLVNKNANEMKK